LFECFDGIKHLFFAVGKACNYLNHLICYNLTKQKGFTSAGPPRGGGLEGQAALGAKKRGAPKSGGREKKNRN
jgi:hypothetical protein